MARVTKTWLEQRDIPVQIAILSERNPFALSKWLRANARKKRR